MIDWACHDIGLVDVRKPRTFVPAGWLEGEQEGASPEAIRNILIGAIYGPGGAA